MVRWGALVFASVWLAAHAAWTSPQTTLDANATTAHDATQEVATAPLYKPSMTLLPTNQIGTKKKTGEHNPFNLAEIVSGKTRAQPLAQAAAEGAPSPLLAWTLTNSLKMAMCGAIIVYSLFIIDSGLGDEEKSTWGMIQWLIVSSVVSMLLLFTGGHNPYYMGWQYYIVLNSIAMVLVGWVGLSVAYMANATAYSAKKLSSNTTGWGSVVHVCAAIAFTLTILVPMALVLSTGDRRYTAIQFASSSIFAVCVGASMLRALKTIHENYEDGDSAKSKMRGGASTGSIVREAASVAVAFYEIEEDSNEETHTKQPDSTETIIVTNHNLKSPRTRSKSSTGAKSTDKAIASVRTMLSSAPLLLLSTIGMLIYAMNLALTGERDYEIATASTKDVYSPAVDACYWATLGAMGYLQSWELRCKRLRAGERASYMK